MDECPAALLFVGNSSVPVEARRLNKVRHLESVGASTIKPMISVVERWADFLTAEEKRMREEEKDNFLYSTKPIKRELGNLTPGMI